MNLRVDSLWVDQGLPGSLVRDIEQDQDGYLWFATWSGLARYDGYRITTIPLTGTVNREANQPVPDIRSLSLADDGKLWIAAGARGLFVHEADVIHQVEILGSDGEQMTPVIYSIEHGTAGTIYLGTQRGLVIIDTGGLVLAHHTLVDDESVEDVSVLSILRSDHQGVWLGGNSGVFHRQDENQSFESIPLGDYADRISVRDLHEDDSGSIWIASSIGLFMTDRSSPSEISPIRELGQINAISLMSHDNVLWVGTLDEGLFRVQNQSEIQHFTYVPGAEHSLKDDVVLSLFHEDSESLWIGTFNAGINRLDLSTLVFGQHDDQPGSVPCMPSRVVYSLFEDSKGINWIGTEAGLVEFNEMTSFCRHHVDTESDTSGLSHPQVNAIIEDAQGDILVSTAKGLNRINRDSSSIDRLEGQVPEKITYFAAPIDTGAYWLGTRSGLYRYDADEGVSSQIVTGDSRIDSASFIAASADKNGSYWFATSAGLLREDDERHLVLATAPDSPIHGVTVDSLLIHNDTIWAGIERRGLARMKMSAVVEQMYPLGDQEQPVSVVAGLQMDENNALWVSTSRGLYRIQPDSGEIKRFDARDGLQSNVFTRGSSFQSASGKLYFGGRRGFNAFYPEQIKINTVPPRVVFTGFSRFNDWQSETPSEDGFSLPGPIESLTHLDLSHRDYVFGIEFAGLHYADPSSNRYRYLMEGFDPDWTEVDASNRHVTYTNLPSGRYTFRVRAANKDGVWSEDEATLSIRVYPPPWFSPWAIAGYVLAFIVMTLLYVHIRTRNAEQRAAELKQEVKLRTTEVAEQRDTIEALLTRKNQMFANVSHEFRTPLTLILGPLEKLVNAPENPKQKSVHKMILRNARRLLLLVDQLLKMARLDRNDPQQAVSQNVATIIRFVVSSFQSMADDKHIRLSLDAGGECHASVAPDTIETIAGNLLSNAIKYTPTGGEVEVSYRSVDSMIEIAVTDTGPGLSEKELSMIFERFVRLEQHSNEIGSGIGLALVKEMAESQGGEISASSETGRGSRFSVRLPAAEAAADDVEIDSDTVEQLSEINQLQPKVAPPLAPPRSEHRATVLIIEDNPDMQAFIHEALKDSYHCLLAGNGQDGVATALKEIPDVIVSDVMMPGMDGFQVSRVIRSDDRTSHIPIILLTARGDKDSRMQGWKEQVDEYLTKPFDAEELQQRIRNILSIRDILRRQAGQQLSQGEVPTQLNKRDQAFVSKIRKAIEDNFHNPLFGRAELASKLAVSERQLQRKLKALIDDNPSELLREYRLVKAAEFLTDGKQVSIVADECGFSSPSHFSQSFKARYGLSPKQYQMETV